MVLVSGLCGCGGSQGDSTGLVNLQESSQSSLKRRAMKALRLAQAATRASAVCYLRSQVSKKTFMVDKTQLAASPCRRKSKGQVNILQMEKRDTLQSLVCSGGSG